MLVQKVNPDNSLTYIASGFVAGNASLAVGATSGTQSFPFTLPNGTPGTGDIRVTVTTDSGQTVKEFDANGNAAYGNNTSSTDATSTLATSPDLVVQAIVVNGGSSSPVLPSQTIPVTWKRRQPGARRRQRHLDRPGLPRQRSRRDPEPPAPRRSVNESGQPGGLRLGKCCRSPATITIPATDVGNKYVVVETGLSESFFEFNTSNNTSVSTSFITIPPSVTVSLAAPGNSTFNKNTVNPATSATVTRNDTSVGNLTVTITSSDPSAVLLAAKPGDTPTASIDVVIPNGAYSAVFYVDAVQDHIVDGTQTSSLNPTAAGYLSIPATATELETNTPTLTLTLATNTFADNSGTTATLTLQQHQLQQSARHGGHRGHRQQRPERGDGADHGDDPGGPELGHLPDHGRLDHHAGRHSLGDLHHQHRPVDPVTGRNFAASAASATVTDTSTPTLELAPDALYVARRTRRTRRPTPRSP